MWTTAEENVDKLKSKIPCLDFDATEIPTNIDV